MQEFSRVYMPIIGVLVLVSGFWYVKAYFGFFGMNEIIPDLGVNYVGQFSLTVLYSLLSFQDLMLSFSFLSVLLFIAFVSAAIPNVRFKHPLIKAIIGTESIPLLPFWVRMFICVSVSFSWILGTAEDLGKLHACQVTQHVIGVPSTVDSIASRFQYEALFGAFGYDSNSGQEPPQIFEVWRNSDYLYLSKRQNDCTAPRTVLKIAASNHDVIRFNLETH